MLPAALRTGPLLAGVHPVNGHRVALEDVVLGEHLPAALAAEVPLPEVNGQDVALEDVPLGEASAALAAAVVALLQVHRLDVALQDVVLREGLPAFVALVVPVLQVDRQDVTLENVVLGEGLAAVLAVVLPVLEVHQVGVALDVALGGEALAAELAIVLDVGVHGADVLHQGEVVGEALVAEVALVPGVPHVDQPLVLQHRLQALERLAADVAVDVGDGRVHPLDVALQELPPAENLSALGAPDAPAVDVGRDRLDVIVVVVVDVVVDLLLDDVRVHVQNNLFRHFIGIGRIPETQETGSCSSFASKGCLS